MSGTAEQLVRQQTSTPVENLSIGIFLDAVCQDDNGLWAHPDAAAFLTFAVEASSKVGSTVLICRPPTPHDDLVRVTTHHVVRVVHLPSYVLAKPMSVVAAIPRAWKISRRELTRLDAIWCFGPGPVAVFIAAIAALLGTRLVLGVRQDTLQYFRQRARTRAQPLVTAAAWSMEAAFRTLATGRGVTAVGRPAVRRYRARSQVLDMRVSLVRERRPVPLSSTPVPLDPHAEGPRALRLVTVGRLAAEKNPALILDTVELLTQRSPLPIRWRWIGDGPLRESLLAETTRRGLSDQITWVGYVGQGPELEHEYAHADIFVHTALSEGLPQVLFEAANASLPIIATEVGGVRDALHGGAAGLLVAPGDADALARAIVRLESDPDHAHELRAQATILLSSTLKEEARRVADFLSAQVSR